MNKHLLNFIEDHKKLLILNSALSEFAEKGFNGASIRNIAKRADIATGLLYYYFKDKNTLYIELCHCLRKGMKEYYISDIQSDDIFVALYNICKAKLKFYSEQPEAYIVLLEEMRIFPEAFKKDGDELRGDNRFWTKYEKNNLLAKNALLLEIMQYTFDGISNEMFNRFIAGEIRIDEVTVVGIEKAESYVEFFKEIWNII